MTFQAISLNLFNFVRLHKNRGVIIVFYDLYLKLCKSKNVSPTRAAIEIGISKATPTTWKKRGLTPQGETLNKIASYFGVSVDYLLTGEEKAPTPEGERKVNDDDIKFALFGGSEEITDAMYNEVKNFAAYVKNREKGNK